MHVRPLPPDGDRVTELQNQIRTLLYELADPEEPYEVIDFLEGIVKMMRIELEEQL